MRNGETDGVDYNFVSHEEFERLVENHALSEYRAYTTSVQGVKGVWYYGTPKLDARKDLVGVVTPSGAKSFIDMYKPQNIEIVYIEASDETRKARAMMRGSFDETEWERRLATDEVDFSKKEIKALQGALQKPLLYYNNDNTNSQEVLGMNEYIVIFTDNTMANVKAWDKASAYEFAQDIYNKPIKEVCGCIR